MSSDDDLEVDFERLDVFEEKLRDAAIPGYAAECDPEEAEEMGAFVEDALDEDEAMEAALDMDLEDNDHA